MRFPLRSAAADRQKPDPRGLDDNLARRASRMTVAGMN